MSLREAFYLAADHIERHPVEYDFCHAYSSPKYSHRGCALVWIGWFHGMQAEDHYATRVASDLLALPGRRLPYDLFSSEERFFARMSALERDHEWMQDAAQCARLLRRYADTYYPQADIPLAQAA